MIVGIDPGTTVGYVCLDCFGRLVELDSEKHLNLDFLISRIIRLGKPVAVGCDVRKAPHFVAKFSVKTRAKLVVPDKNLLRRDKEIMTSDWRGFVKNNHQRSALASALHAYAVFKPLLERIRKRLHGDLVIFDDVVAKVLTRNVSIQQAQEMIR